MRETIKVQYMHDRPTGGKQYKEYKGQQENRPIKKGGPTCRGAVKYRSHRAVKYRSKRHKKAWV